MAKYIQQELGVDEVWFLFSVNWQKDAAKYASIEHRMEMGRIMARHYSGVPLVMSDIQDKLGTHITYNVLTRLRAEFPDDRFVWVMGADNLVSFHTWEHADDIIENFPIAVVGRPPYTEKAQKSYTALTYPHLKIEEPKDLLARSNGWCFLNNPQIEMSSSHLLQKLRDGHKEFAGPFQDVANYILQHDLYGVCAKTHEPLTRPEAQPK